MALLHSSFEQARIGIMTRVTDPLIRAYQLAPSCRSLAEVKQKLKDEGFINIESHFGGASLRKEIKRLLAG